MLPCVRTEYTFTGACLCSSHYPGRTGVKCAHLGRDSAREERLPTVCLVIVGGLSLVGDVGSEHTGEAAIVDQQQWLVCIRPWEPPLVTEKINLQTIHKAESP